MHSRSRGGRASVPLRQRAVRLGIGLKREGGRHAVLVAAQFVRQRRPVAGHGIVLRQHQRRRGKQRERDRPPRQLPSPLDGKIRGDADQHYGELERAREQLQAKPGAERHAIARSRARAQTGQRAEDKAARAGRNGAAPICIHPVAQHAELHHGQQAADYRPAWRQPRAKHPISESAQRTHREQHASPRRSEDEPARGHREALAHRKNRTVRRLLQHKHRFEKLAHRMHRICEAEMAQGIG